MHDTLVPDPVVAEEFHVTLMTMWRWDRDPTKITFGWPPKIQIGKRNYRTRQALETFKQNLIAAALAKRDSKLAEGATS